MLNETINKTMHILVIGDECTDKFVVGDINRLSPEAPVPVLNPTKTIHNPGMAGNVKQNLRSLGALPCLPCRCIPNSGI